MENKKKVKRYYEIDIIKSIAVILMVVFHFYYIYYLIGKPLVNMDNKILVWSSIISHTLFIFLFGINLSLSYNKNENKSEYYEKQIQKSIIYLFIGTIISFVSYKLIPNKFIFFGIFQFFSLSILISQPFVTNEFTSIIGLVIFSLLNLLQKNRYKNNLINNIIGLNTNFNSIDYFPFIPYFIYVLLGITVGHLVYKKGKRSIDLDYLDKKVENSKLLQFLIYIGQNSLIIYVLHWILFYMVM